MKTFIFSLVIMFLLIPSPSAAILTADDENPAPVWVMEDYRVFKEEKLRLSRERAMKREVLPTGVDRNDSVDSAVPHDGGDHNWTSPATVTASGGAPPQIAGEDGLDLSPYLSGSWQLLPLVLVPLGAMAFLSALSLRNGMLKKKELKAARKARRKQLHREIEDQFRSYFPRMT